MLTIRFDAADLARVRFAISPLFELWQSIRALQSPVAESLHQPWIAETRARVRDRGLDLSLLYALQQPNGWNPDYIHPPPTGPLAEFENELAQLLSTPTERLKVEFSRACLPGPPPALLDSFAEDPDGMLVTLADLLRAYWQLALAPHWDRLRALLQGDILYRARQAADGGAESLFADVDSNLTYGDAQIHVRKPWDLEIDLKGRGLVLLPSVFIWTVAVIYEPPWQPTIIYPARGTALVWEAAPAAPEALAALIGSRRASVLAALDVPRSTTELSHRLGAPAGGVSQHLSVLGAAGLVSRHRVGRVVLYRRTPTGELLANRQVQGPRPVPPFASRAG